MAAGGQSLAISDQYETFIFFYFYKMAADVIGSDVPWLECPLQRFNMGHINRHRINLYGVSMTLMRN